MGSKRTTATSQDTFGVTPTQREPDARVNSDTNSENTFNSALQTALNSNDIRAARGLVAEMEEHLRNDATSPADPRYGQLAAAKARIALAGDDALAAHAILVRAIEAAPDDRSLRVLMSEVMMSTGRAADVRPVLSHIGKTPTPRLDMGHAPDLAEDGSR